MASHVGPSAGHSRSPEWGSGTSEREGPSVPSGTPRHLGRRGGVLQGHRWNQAHIRVTVSKHVPLFLSHE